MKETKKLSVMALILMIFTTVFGFTNITRSFYLMGYAAIPWFILSALLFFIPYAFINAEFGAAFKDSKGGIYTWMEKSVGPKYAFVGIFMWYASYVIWLVAIALTIWVGVSYMIFGAERTSTWSLFGLPNQATLGVLAVLWMSFLTYLGTKGVEWVKKIASIGGTATALINVILIVSGIVLFIAHGGQFSQPITSTSFTLSPNPAYNNIVAMAGFVVMALFAYGGIEAVAGYVDNTENAEKNFPKGLKLAAIIITVGYSLGIFIVGIFCNWQTHLSGKNVHIGNASYEVMRQLGVSLGKLFGMANPDALGQFIIRYMAISLFLAMIGAYLTLLSAPLQQLMEGTPKELWPAKLNLRENGVPKNALIAQAILVILLITIVAIAGGTGGKLFMNITMMMNTSMTLPYVFVALAFIGFKAKDEIKKPFLMFKKKATAKIAAWSCAITIVLGNILQVADPLFNYYKHAPKLDAVARAEAYKEAITGAGFMIVAPILFTILALIIYNNYEKKVALKNINNSVNN